MIAAVLLASTLHFAAGDTMSTVAASHGVSLSSLEAANPQITDPNVIFAGEGYHLPGGNPNSISGDSSVRPASISGDSSTAPSGTGTSSGGFSSSDVASVPGVPRSFAACVAWRESGNGQYAAYNGGVYGIITASGINVNGQSLAAQKQAFAQLYAQYGSQPWSPSDGC